MNKGFPMVPLCTGCLLIGALETAGEGTSLGGEGNNKGGSQFLKSLNLASMDRIFR